MDLSTRTAKSRVSRPSTCPERDPHRKGRLRRGARKLRKVLPVASEIHGNTKAHRQNEPLSEAHRETMLHPVGLIGELRLRAPVLRNQNVEPSGAEPVADKQLSYHVR